MNRLALLGLLLWRGGTLFVAGVVAFHAARFLLRWVDVPPLLGTGLALMGAGFLLVLVSLVAERIQEARQEKGLGA